MRKANIKEQFTMFGLWLQEYVRQDISITNVDYFIEDYKGKRIMLVEEKKNLGQLHTAQRLSFEVLDFYLARTSSRRHYNYWGFFVLQLPKGATMPGPGMTLNGHLITTEQLQSHLNFEHCFCEPYPFEWREQAQVEALKNTPVGRSSTLVDLITGVRSSSRGVPA